MEVLTNCGIVVEIENIINIVGGNQEFKILALTKDRGKIEICIDNVWSMQYSIENVNISRFCHYREYNELPPPYSSIMTVEESSYLAVVKKEIGETYPSENLKHYIIIDKVDTVLDIVALTEPKITSII